MVDAQKTETFNMRVTPDFLRLVDDWRRVQADLPSRAEAVRRLVLRGLECEQSPGSLENDGRA